MCLLIQIVVLVIFLINYFARKKIVQNIASPPPKEILTLKQKVIYTKDDEKIAQTKDKEFDEYIDNADSEKKIQEKDEAEEETYNNINTSNNKNLNSEIITESINTEANNENLTSRKNLDDFKFEKMNPDEAENNLSKLSEIKRNSVNKENNSSSYSRKDSINYSRKSSIKSLDLSEDEIFTLAKSCKPKLELDYLILKKAIEKDERTISELYLHLLPLKQPIWDILSNVKALESNKSFVPLTLKIIRFIFNEEKPFLLIPIFSFSIISILSFESSNFIL